MLRTGSHQASLMFSIENISHVICCLGRSMYRKDIQSLQYLCHIITKSFKPKHIHQLDNKGDPIQPLLSTRLPRVHKRSRHQVL